MRATELQIGDWVHVNTKCNPRNVKVIGIGKHDCINVKGDFWYNEDTINPIPLTEEILKTNGFVRETHWSHASVYRMFTDDRTYLIEYTRYTNSEDILGKSLLVIETYSIKGINNVHILDCISVHELQHALRLCGLNDLADNFKIEEV